jgi:hypothetical protein
MGAMSFTHQSPPLTPLDALRVLLATFAEEDGGFATRLTHAVQGLRRRAIRELGTRLRDPGTSRGLRRAIYALVGRFDWPEWVPFFQEALHHEPDLGVFDEGCAALGILGLREASEALKALALVRQDHDHLMILNREISLYVPQQSLQHYLGRLMEGQANLRFTHQGAKFLSVMLQPGDLGSLREAYRNGDPLTQRLALKLLVSLQDPAPFSLLLELLEGYRLEFQDNLLLRGLLDRTATMPRAAVRDAILKLVAARFEARVPEAAAKLRAALGKEDFNPSTALEVLRPQGVGAYETFLLDAAGLLLEGKVARFTAFLAEAAETLEARQALIQGHAEFLGESLATQVDRGWQSRDAVLPALARCFQAQFGLDGLLQAYLWLLPPTAEEVLETVLQEPDMARRQKCLDALGAREEDALSPFFLRAMQDPIVEVGQLAIHHLGKLPSSFPALLEFFQSGHMEQVRRAIGVFGENQTQAAAEHLVAFVQRDTRDDLLVEAVDALAAIRCPTATPVLLDLLHDGKPLALQIALANALGSMGLPEASLGMLHKAAALKQSQVLILALEGALAAFPGFETPLPVPAVPELLALLERCCDEREGEGQRLRAMLAAEGLFTFEQSIYEALKDRFGDFLFDMRTKEAWDRENNDRVAAIIKELARRSAGLGLLARKEAEIRGRMQRLPESGPKRAEELLALRENLADPDMILRPEVAGEIAERVLLELGRRNVEWREVAHLCEIGGLTHRTELIEGIREEYQRAQGLGLKSAARTALARLGLSPQEMERRAPVRTILVLEPSAFFRKRLVSFLNQGHDWQVLEAGSRQEADQLLASPVDVLLSESQDGEGDLSDWLVAAWNGRRCGSVLLSTSNRAAASLGQGPQLRGVLFKPYPLELLVDILGT